MSPLMGQRDEAPSLKNQECDILLPSQGFCTPQGVMINKYGSKGKVKLSLSLAN
jgi:hypothetical protein